MSNQAILKVLSTPMTAQRLIEELIEYDYYPTENCLSVRLCQLNKKGLITSTKTRCTECGKAITLHETVKP